MAKIKLYRDCNFSGPTKVFTGSVPNLVDQGFNDETSAIVVEEGNWLTFQDVNYKGTGQVLTPGNYPNPSDWGGSNDSLSSLKPLAFSGQLSPSSDFKSSYQQIVDLSKRMNEFNNNLDFHQQISILTGEAQDIARSIQAVLVPQIKVVGQQVYSAISNTENVIRAVASSMIHVCDQLKNSSPNTFDISMYLRSALSSAEMTYNDITNQVTPRLDTYHEDLNQLISKLGSEELAIEDNNNELKHEREKILQQMHARTHTVCGVVKMIWDAVTFQLEAEIKKEEQKLAHIRCQFNCNSIAMGGAQHMIDTIKNFRGAIEKQTTYWQDFKSLMYSLISDTSSLIQTEDKDIWDLYIDMVKSDWLAVQNIS